jgi:hypothetical protein
MRAQQLTIMSGGQAVAIYIFIPIVLLSVRTVIWSPIHDTEWAAQPRWKRPVGGTAIPLCTKSIFIMHKRDYLPPQAFA